VLSSASWPGNVRELKNLIERIVVLENTEMIGPEHIPGWITGGTLSNGSMPSNGFQLPDAGIDMEKLERNLIQQALKKTEYNKALAAKLLNISYDSLRYQVKKFGLENR
jgi:transcriptional regulator with PAS, ATPase and Fis domain